MATRSTTQRPADGVTEAVENIPPPLLRMDGQN